MQSPSHDLFPAPSPDAFTARDFLSPMDIDCGTLMLLMNATHRRDALYGFLLGTTAGEIAHEAAFLLYCFLGEVEGPKYNLAGECYA